jgi:hypothetical protein
MKSTLVSKGGKLPHMIRKLQPNERILHIDRSYEIFTKYILKYLRDEEGLLYIKKGGLTVKELFELYNEVEYFGLRDLRDYLVEKIIPKCVFCGACQNDSFLIEHEGCECEREFIDIKMNGYAYEMYEKINYEEIKYHNMCPETVLVSLVGIDSGDKDCLVYKILKSYPIKRVSGESGVRRLYKFEYKDFVSSHKDDKDNKNVIVSTDKKFEVVNENQRLTTRITINPDKTFSYILQNNTEITNTSGIDFDYYRGGFKRTVVINCPHCGYDGKNKKTCINVHVYE